MPKLTREQLDREEAARQARYAANVAKWGEHRAFCPPTREQRNARRRELYAAKRTETRKCEVCDKYTVGRTNTRTGPDMNGGRVTLKSWKCRECTNMWWADETNHQKV